MLNSVSERTHIPEGPGLPVLKKPQTLAVIQSAPKLTIPGD